MKWDSYNNIIMQYQEIIDLLDNTPKQQSKFKTKNWVEINDLLYGVYNIGSQIKFKTTMQGQVYVIIVTRT